MPRPPLALALAPLVAIAFVAAGCGSSVTTSAGTSAATTSGTGGSGQGSGAAGAGGTPTSSGTTTATECMPDQCETAYSACCDDATGVVSPMSDCVPPTCRWSCPPNTTPLPAYSRGDDCVRRFDCGTSHCKGGREYCRHSISDVGSIPDTFECIALPDACGDTPTCACVAEAPCGGLCEASAAGDLTVTCPGG
jgi:hypothetical protein